MLPVATIEAIFGVGNDGLGGLGHGVLRLVYYQYDSSHGPSQYLVTLIYKGSAFALATVALLALLLEGATLTHSVPLGGALVTVSEGMTVAVSVVVRGVHCHWFVGVVSVLLIITP